MHANVKLMLIISPSRAELFQAIYNPSSPLLLLSFHLSLLDGNTDLVFELKKFSK